MSEKHEFRIVDDEIALILRCDGEPAEGTIGIYEDMPGECSRCGEKLVLEMSARLRRLAPLDSENESTDPSEGEER